MSAFDVLLDPCASCPDGPRTKGGACDNAKAQWLCDRHFVAYAHSHAKCKACWGPTGTTRKREAFIMPGMNPDGSKRGWK